MGRVGTAFRAFFRILGDRALADDVCRLLDGELKPTIEQPLDLEAQQPVMPKPAPASATAARPSSSRNGGLDLLSALQREARFVDFVKESLSDYQDAQIGAAVRDIHRDCAKLIDRMFAVEPITAQEEGSSVELAPGYDSVEYRLTGNVSGEPPIRGRLVHRGWKATKCEVPAWTAGEAGAKVIAPAEVEII